MQARPPFNFDLSAMVFSDKVGLSMRDEQICKYSNGKYWRVLEIDGKLILVTIKSIGNVNKPRLEVELASNEQISESDKETVRELIFRTFDLGSDLKPFYKAMEQDTIMSRLVKELYGLKAIRLPTVFEAMVYVILAQQISLQASHAIERRLIKKSGNVLKIDDKVYYAFPTPEKFASLEIDDFRSCGVSRRKAEYIRDIAQSIVDKKLDLATLEHKEDKEIMEELCSIRGVGRWTAELVMIRGMGKLTVIPADDLGLRDHVSHYYFRGEGRVSSEEVRKVAVGWGKWMGIAGFYVVMAGMLRVGNTFPGGTAH